MEEVEIETSTRIGKEVIKKRRTLVLLDVLFAKGAKDKDVQAIKEYFDRQLGKASQPIDLSGGLKVTKMGEIEGSLKKIANDARKIPRKN